MQLTIDLQSMSATSKGYSEDARGTMYNGTYTYDRAYSPNRPTGNSLPLSKLPELTQSLLKDGWDFEEANYLAKTVGNYSVTISSYPEKSDVRDANYSLPRSDGYLISIVAYNIMRGGDETIEIKPSGNAKRDLKAINAKLKKFA